MKKSAIILSLGVASCTSPALFKDRVIPAQEYSDAVKSGSQDHFSIYNIAKQQAQQPVPQMNDGVLIPASATVDAPSTGLPTTQLQRVPGGQRLLGDGFKHYGGVDVPGPTIDDGRAQLAAVTPGLPPAPGSVPAPPPGSSAPYYLGQMTANASLWPDESQGSSLFRDLRAFQPMDVVTIQINEQVEGQKRTQTDAQSRFSLLAAITNFFGLETGWAGNNQGLDPENLINAQMDSTYQGTGQTRRLGFLRGQISAVVLEVLPNGLLRVEGTKIVSVDSEEEVMVVSGLVRLRDIDALNKVDSSRIANMRVDFYGKGTAGDVTSPGWMTRALRVVWPF